VVSARFKFPVPIRRGFIAIGAQSSPPTAWRQPARPGRTDWTVTALLAGRGAEAMSSRTPRFSRGSAHRHRGQPAVRRSSLVSSEGG